MDLPEDLLSESQRLIKDIIFLLLTRIVNWHFHTDPNGWNGDPPDLDLFIMHSAREIFKLMKHHNGSFEDYLSLKDVDTTKARFKRDYELSDEEYTKINAEGQIFSLLFDLFPSLTCVAEKDLQKLADELIPRLAELYAKAYK